MKRSEKNKIKRENYIYNIKLCIKGVIIFALLIVVLFTGLIIVDEANRSVLLFEEAFFEYEKLPDNELFITFLGEKYYFDTSSLDTSILNASTKIKREYGKLTTLMGERGMSLENFVYRASKKSKEIFTGLYK